MTKDESRPRGLWTGSGGGRTVGRMRDTTAAIKRAGGACAPLVLNMFFHLLGACDDAGRASDPPTPGSVVVTTAEGDGSTGSSTSTSGEAADTEADSTSFPAGHLETSTGEGGSTSASTSTGDGDATSGSSSTGSGSTGDTTGDGSSSGGESTGDEPPTPSVCGDGVCDAAEAAAGCFKPGWCWGDCKAEQECLTPCPCTDGIYNLCYLAPGTCDAVQPGGLCDPNGDGNFADGDFTWGSLLYQAKCGA